MAGIISLQRSIEHRCLPLYESEEPDDEEGEGLALEKLDGVEKRALAKTL